MILETSDVVFKETIFPEKAYSIFFLKNFKLLLLNFKVVVICNFHRLYNICTILKIVFICKNSFSVLDLEIAPAGQNSGVNFAGHGWEDIVSRRPGRWVGLCDTMLFSLLSISIRQVPIKLQDMVGRIEYLVFNVLAKT